MPGPKPGSAGQFANLPAGARLAQRRLDDCGLGTPFPSMLLTPIVPATAEEPIVILRRTCLVISNLLVESLAIVGGQRKSALRKNSAFTGNCITNDSVLHWT